MRTTFSKSWVASTQTRKQRKYRYNAPSHIKSKFLSCHLSAELRKTHSKRSIRVKKGDTVKIVAGQFKKQTGKVERVSVAYSKVYVTGIENVKKNGAKSLIPIEPSNIMITDLELSDKKRVAKLKNKL